MHTSTIHACYNAIAALQREINKQVHSREWACEEVTLLTYVRETLKVTNYHEYTISDIHYSTWYAEPCHVLSSCAMCTSILYTYVCDVMWSWLYA